MIVGWKHFGILHYLEVEVIVNDQLIYGLANFSGPLLCNQSKVHRKGSHQNLSLGWRMLISVSLKMGVFAIKFSKAYTPVMCESGHLESESRSESSRLESEFT